MTHYNAATQLSALPLGDFDRREEILKQWANDNRVSYSGDTEELAKIFYGTLRKIKGTSNNQGGKNYAKNGKLHNKNQLKCRRGSR